MAERLLSDRPANERTSAGVLRFNVVGGVLQAALTRAGGSSRGAIGAGDGIGIDARVVLTRRELDIIRADRALQTALKREIDNLGRLGVDRLRRMHRTTRTIRTGLAMSGWRANRVRSGKLVVAQEFTNPTPYMRWIHPKGRKRPTLLQREVNGPGGVQARLEDDLVDSLIRLTNTRTFRDAVKAEIVAALGGR